MSLNWTTVKSLAIPVGGVSRDVKRVSIGGSVVWEKNALPYDAEVEYLESTGTQWIDTGVAFSKFYSFALSARLTPTYNESDLFGAYYQTNTNKMVCGSYRNFIFGFNPPGARIDSAALGTSEIDVDISYEFSSTGARTLTVNGAVYTASTGYVTNRNITLFRGNPGYDGAFKCYSFKIYDTDGTTLVRDYIPVRKGTVGYLYDRVSGQLFGNAGTGDFVVGPDVVPVEYIESQSGYDSGNGQTIDTGIPLNTIYGLNLKYNALGFVQGKYKPIIAYSDYTFSFSTYTGTGFYLRNNGAQIFVNKGAGLGATDNTATINGSTYDFGFDSGDTITPPLASTADTLRLFGVAGWRTFPVRIYDLTLYGSANNQLAHYVPARVGSGSSWEGAMMDTLTRRIYRNAGTGAFTYGADLPYPIGG